MYGLYDYLLMAMYVVFGHTPLLPKLLNAALAALCAVLLMEVARKAWGASVGLVAGIAAAILPTMVIWSIVTLKEIPVLFVVLIGLRALQVLTDVPLRSGAAANALVTLAAARSQIRSQTDVFTAEGQEIVYAEAVSDATPFNFTNDVIDPLGYALLSPAPWQARSLRDAAAGAEMLVWYALMGASLFAWRLRPRAGQGVFVVCLVLYGLANWLVLAASEGNLGNLLRHRLMLVPPLLVLSSAGLVWLWPRLGRVRLAAREPQLETVSR